MLDVARNIYNTAPGEGLRRHDLMRESKDGELRMNRSCRATNAQRFDADGTWKKSAKAINRPKRCQKLTVKYKERKRRLAAERKRCHGEFAYRVLGQRTIVKAEKLSYKPWQRGQCGKSSKVGGARMFVGILRNKVHAAGGDLIGFGMRYTRLCQFDHLGGTLTPKSLKQPYQQIADGTCIGGDLYSAFRAWFVGEDGLDASQAEKAWSGMEAFLRAGSHNFEPVSGRGFVLPNLSIGAPSRKVREADDAVTLVARASAGGVIRSYSGVT